MSTDALRQKSQQEFLAAVRTFDERRPVLILSHNDADGLASAAILSKALQRASTPAQVRVLGRGENPWSPGWPDSLDFEPGGLIVADLGVRSERILGGVPTVLIDHHVPRGAPPAATVITGYGHEPTPTSGLLAFWCAQTLADIDDLLWLAAISLIGDMAEDAGFAEMAEARQRYGVTALRDATALLNAARRAGSGDARPAFKLLMKAGGPKEIVSGSHPETAVLKAAREEVKTALEVGKRVAPRIRGDVALIVVHSPCQIHPLLAQTWRGRLKKNIVIAANTGFRPGRVHFAVRSATGRNLVEFLREKAPAGADEEYGSGHEQATGGALTAEDWNEFLGKLGFGSPAEAAA